MIFHGQGVGYWTDLNPHSLYRQPNEHIPAAEAALYTEALRQADLFGRERDMIYNTGSVKYRVGLELLVMPALAAVLTIFAGGVTTVEGHFIGEDGVLAGANEDSYDIAGVLLPYYFSVFGDGPVSNLDYVVTTLNPGDAIWVVRHGEVELWNGEGAAATAIGDRVVALANGHAGILAPWTTVDPTLAQLIANSWFKRLGLWRAVVAAGAVGRADLDMPRRGYGQRVA